MDEDDKITHTIDHDEHGGVFIGPVGKAKPSDTVVSKTVLWVFAENEEMAIEYTSCNLAYSTRERAFENAHHGDSEFRITIERMK